MAEVLVVVDYQADFVGGSLGFPGAEALEGPIADKIEACLARGGDLIFTLDTHDAGYLSSQEGRGLPIPHCIKGSAGHSLYGRVAGYGDRGLMLEKPVFGSAALLAHLQGRAYTRIELCGLVSHICVLSNAVICRTALPEAEIVVDSRCTAGPDADMHQKALDIMAGLQVTVL